MRETAGGMKVYVVTWETMYGESGLPEAAFGSRERADEYAKKARYSFPIITELELDGPIPAGAGEPVAIP